MVGAVVFGGRWRRQAAILLAVGVSATVGYFVVLAPLAARQRVTMADTSGRSSIWTVAWRVVEAHPVLGVGNDNFILVEDRYVNQPGAVLAIYIIVTPESRAQRVPGGAGRSRRAWPADAAGRAGWVGRRRHPGGLDVRAIRRPSDGTPLALCSARHHRGA